MAILIKNPETERKVRELAALKCETITGVIDAAVERELVAAKQARRRPTLEEMKAATDRLWEESGLQGPFAPVTKAEWDEINEIPGLLETDE